ncbi:hypothetical protein KCU89_g13, partial [Aureobasidium melanogenum]
MRYQRLILGGIKSPPLRGPCKQQRIHLMLEHTFLASCTGFHCKFFPGSQRNTREDLPELRDQHFFEQLETVKAIGGNVIGKMRIRRTLHPVRTLSNGSVAVERPLINERDLELLRATMFEQVLDSHHTSVGSSSGASQLEANALIYAGSDQGCQGEQMIAAYSVRAFLDDSTYSYRRKLLKRSEGFCHLGAYHGDRSDLSGDALFSALNLSSAGETIGSRALFRGTVLMSKIFPSRAHPCLHLFMAHNEDSSGRLLGRSSVRDNSFFKTSYCSYHQVKHRQHSPASQE